MLSPEQVEFLAGSAVLVDIVPSVRLEDLQLQVDEQRTRRFSLWPNTPVRVPLWLALLLRNARHCRIVVPPFLHPGELMKMLEEELRTEDAFSPLPPHWYEAAIALLKSAPEDFAVVDPTHQVPLLVQRLREQRMSKLAGGLATVDGDPTQMDHVGIMELNVGAKPMLLPAMDLLVAIRQPPSQLGTSDLSSESQSMSNNAGTLPPPSTDIAFFSQNM